MESSTLSFHFAPPRKNMLLIATTAEKPVAKKLWYFLKNTFAVQVAKRCLKSSKKMTFVPIMTLTAMRASA